MTNDNATELLPCSFCGGEADISDEGEGTEPYRFWSYCANGKCFVEGTPAFETENEAIDAWNTRHERTCTVESSFLNDFSSEHECWWEFDLSCGHHVIGDTMNAPNYCEVCGAKAVGE